MNPFVREVTKQNSSIKCNYCHLSKVNSLEWGPLYQLDGVSVHYFCMLFSAGLSQNGEDEDGILGFLPKDVKKELKRGEKLKCKFCKGVGATIGCSVKTCKTSYHYPCGLERSCVFQFLGNYESYCFKHKDILDIPLPKSEWECPICISDVGVDEYPLWPPCCKKRVFHKTCIMTMAKNHGAHFFKCPLCNDKDIFSTAMRKCGVYLPDRDAAWELEPNAFADHARVYSKCDATTCICPKGREYSNKDDCKPWKIVRCGACGASAIHKTCGKLNNLTWRCPTCSDVLSGRRHNDTLNSSRIQRHHYDTDTSSDEETPPVAGVLDVIQKVTVDRSSDSDDESSNSEGTRAVVFDSVYGKKFRMECEDSEEGSSNAGSEDSDSDDEEANGVIHISSSAKLRTVLQNDMITSTADGSRKHDQTDNEFLDNVSNPVRTVSPEEIAPISSSAPGKDNLIKTNAKNSLKQCATKIVKPPPQVLKESPGRSVKISLRSRRQSGKDMQKVEQATSIEKSPTQHEISFEKDGGANSSKGKMNINNSEEVNSSNVETYKRIEVDNKGETEEAIIELSDSETDDNKSDIEIVAEKLVPASSSPKTAAVLEMLEKIKSAKAKCSSPRIKLGVDDDENDDIEITGACMPAKPSINISSCGVPNYISAAYLSVINQNKAKDKSHFSGSIAERRKLGKSVLGKGKLGPDRDVEIVELESDEAEDNCKEGPTQKTQGGERSKRCSKRRDRLSPTGTLSQSKDSVNSKRQRSC